MEQLQAVNAKVNAIIWGPYMLLLLIGVGIFYTIKLKGFQFRFGTWWRATALSVFHRPKNGRKSGGISPFQAMATALAGAIGTGNIVGVAGALTLGGAGAVFWMWIAAVFGMGTIFAENVLGVKYREKRNGKYVGGPMYYIEKGLKCKWAAVIFAVICTVAALGMGNMTQANSVSGALEGGFGISPKISGIIIAGATAFVIFGGIERIAALTEKLVPLMAVLYTLVSLSILVINFTQIPNAFSKIIQKPLTSAVQQADLWGTVCQEQSNMVYQEVYFLTKQVLEALQSFMLLPRQMTRTNRVCGECFRYLSIRSFYVH